VQVIERPVTCYTICIVWL